MNAGINEEINVGKLKLDNRLVMAPMARSLADENGLCTDEMTEFYVARANSKTALLITEQTYVCQQGKAKPTQPSIASDDVIPGYRKLTDEVHKKGSRIFMQLNHAGSISKTSVTGMDVLAPSAVVHPGRDTGGFIPREMTVAEIHEVEDAFAAAAVRAKNAGFDGVEVHAAHCFLLMQFFSPLTNKRNDEYGGAKAEDRFRITAETIRKVRAAVGPDYPISVRIGGSDYADGGSSIEDAVCAAVIAEAAGADLISVSGGLWGHIRAGHEEPGYFSDASKAVKAAVHVPVLLAGGFRSREDAEKFIADGSCDLIGIGRPLLKDADWILENM